MLIFLRGNAIVSIFSFQKDIIKKNVSNIWYYYFFWLSSIKYPFLFSDCCGLPHLKCFKPPHRYFCQFSWLNPFPVSGPTISSCLCSGKHNWLTVNWPDAFLAMTMYLLFLMLKSNPCLYLTSDTRVISSEGPLDYLWEGVCRPCTLRRSPFMTMPSSTSSRASFMMCFK